MPQFSGDRLTAVAALLGLFGLASLPLTYFLHFLFTVSTIEFVLSCPLLLVRSVLLAAYACMLDPVFHFVGALADVWLVCDGRCFCLVAFQVSYCNT